MADEFHPGMWAADQLLASLEEQDAIIEGGRLPQSNDERTSPNMVPGQSNVVTATEQRVVQPVKNERAQVEFHAIPKAVKAPLARGSSKGPRGEERSYANSSAANLPRRPMAQAAFSANKDSTMGARPHNSLGRPVFAGSSSLQPGESSHPAYGLLTAQNPVHQRDPMNRPEGVRRADRELWSTRPTATDSDRRFLSSMPPPARDLPAVDADPPRPEPTAIMPLMRRVDLEKWPCRRCHFIHRGGSCEVSCMGCGSRNPSNHNSTCPFKYKHRLSNGEESPIRIGTLSLNDRPTSRMGQTLSTTLPGKHAPVSATMALSLECQSRGFNPDFQYWRSKDRLLCYANLWIQGHLITDGVAYRGEKEARDALAPTGLEFVRRMGPMRVPKKQESHSQHRDESSTLVPPTAGVSSTRYYGSRQSDDRDVQMGGTGHLPGNTTRSAYDRRPNLRSTAKLPRVPPSGNQGNIHLPGNVDVRDVQDILDSSMADSPNPIAFHLPPNVSTEVAEAYGRGLGAFMAQSQRRARSRSRSPTRLGPMVSRDYRRRDHSCEYRPRPDVEDSRAYRERERDEIHGRRQYEAYGRRLSPPYLPRPYTSDIYRPSPGVRSMSHSRPGPGACSTGGPRPGPGPRTPQRPVDRLRLTPPTGPIRQPSRDENKC